MRNRASYRLQIHLLLVPYGLALGLLVFAPMLYTLALSFTEYDIFSPPRWIALGNFTRLLSDSLFWTALGNSLWFALGTVLLRVAGALLLALALNRDGRAIEFARAVIYLPTIMPEVAYALVWLLILNPGYGPLNLALGAVGLPQFPWLQTEFTARLSLVVMSGFELGEGFVLLLAALQTIPHELFEASALDGASRAQTFRRVIWPLLVPSLLLLAFRDTALSFYDSFAPSVITTETGPYYATFFLPNYIFNKSFGLFQYGYGSAMTVCLYLVGLLLIALQYGALKRGQASDEL
ncbi:MAG: sugar ABC transporter permease [Chloroflexi bacterium]|nr:sugar ABC transporter permease [Chloroflexota bacterium]MBI3733286.1 sugar ABC transporter permease [Chloroflexota bacterium]